MAKSLLGTGYDVGVFGGSTQYFTFGTGFVAFVTTEANQTITQRTGGTISNLSARVQANANNGTTTVRIRKNTANANVVVSIPTTATGTFNDFVNTDVYSSGDTLSIQAAPGATGTVGLNAFYYQLDSASGMVTAYASGGNANLNVAAIYEGLSSQNTNATEANTQMRVKQGGTWQNLFLKVSSNARAAQTVTNRINTANGTMTISVGASTTGTFEDLTHTDTLSVNDVVGYQFSGTASASAFAHIIGSQIVTTSASTLGSTILMTVATAAIAGFVSISGAATDTTLANLNAASPFAFTSSNFGVNVVTNANTGSTTNRFMIGAANGNQSVSVGAAATGYFEDAVNTDSVSQGSLINYGRGAGNGGTLTYSGFYSLVTPPSTAVAGNAVFFATHF